MTPRSHMQLLQSGRRTELKQISTKFKFTGHLPKCRQVKEGVRWYRDESIRMRVYSQPILHEDEPRPTRPDKALWKQVTVRTPSETSFR